MKKPPFFWLTDDDRPGEPLSLPKGSWVIVRGRDKNAQEHHLNLLRKIYPHYHYSVANRPDLAIKYNLPGLHISFSAYQRFRYPIQQWQSRFMLTVSCHRYQDVLYLQKQGIRKCLLSPIFPTKSASQRPVIGPYQARFILNKATTCLILLGGFTSENISLFPHQNVASVSMWQH